MRFAPTRKARTGRNASPGKGGGNGNGIPRYLGRAQSGSNASNPSPASRSASRTPPLAHPPGPLGTLPRNEAAERDAQRATTPGSATSPRASIDSNPLSRQLSRSVVAQAGSGEHLPDSWTERATRMGVSAAQVRVHTGTHAQRFTDGLGANAVTVGRDIFFAGSRYAPGTPEGDRLLAHELTHVAQQRGEPQALQCDIHDAHTAALGVFGVDMATAVIGGNPGMNVNLAFFPDPTGPYSTQIGMVQLVNVHDISGETTTAGGVMDWNKVGNGEEAGRMESMTTGSGLADQGWFVDAMYDPASNPRGGNLQPSYQEPNLINPSPAGTLGQFGWLRSPTDSQETTLRDGPNTSVASADFDFQTFARGTDNQVIYGALEWGFKIRTGTVTDDYARAATSSSAEFGEALDRFQGYFSHENVVVYFDTNATAISPAEQAKLADARDYTDRYPDCRVEVTGFADQRGSVNHNADLSQRRAEAVVGALLAQGIDPARIDTAVGMGATTANAPGSAPDSAGALQSNRRVLVRFIRTATAPINAP
ncbi:MAG: DUF4157 domain-containing protein [Moraxellaceae bacterium]|nr:DUF4157 domain-containing protein [Moraxellaceae bacterium]